LGDSPAALVEKSAATASSLADQAQQLSEPTAAFKVAGDGMMAA
jgi:methyl-accepting chemotaxis protein I, serine sensor receptor